MERVFNFAPGPSMLPLPVLEQIQKELLCYGSTGMSVMEMSHRSSMYLDIFNQTVADLREVMAIPDHYKVIFPQGGATAMFAAVAMNLMDGGHADYVDSGNFAHNALVERTPDRSTLFAVQTPQVFSADLLKAALQSALTDGATITDDCSAVERIGKEVYLTEGSEENLKITTPLDLVIAEAILQRRGE